ncbi:MAG: hypothetical protein ABSF70_09775 [Terracidiphilus sp.]
MTNMIALKKVVLNEGHLLPGRTKHYLCDTHGKQEFAPFTSLVIAQYPGDAGYYLLHICENGQSTDTWHLILDDALHQAEYEFGVRPEEWTDSNEPV